MRAVNFAPVRVVLGKGWQREEYQGPQNFEESRTENGDVEEGEEVGRLGTLW